MSAAKTNIAIVDGEPETVMNAAAVRAAIDVAPCGADEARRRLLAAGVPRHVVYGETVQ